MLATGIPDPQRVILGEENRRITANYVQESTRRRSSFGGFWQEPIPPIAQRDSDEYIYFLRQGNWKKTLSDGKFVHAQLILSDMHRDKFLGNLLLDMYGKHAALYAAHLVFLAILHPNVVSWNIILAAYAHCCRLNEAHYLFDIMPLKNVISWTTMIAAYAQQDPLKAIQLFQQMQQEEISPNNVTFVNILNACANASAFPEGKRIHSWTVDAGLHPDVVISTALANMYGKCGSLGDAHKIVSSFHKKDVVLWTTLIAAYAKDENVKEALHLFRQMQATGLQPDRVTWSCIVDACSNDQASFAEGKHIHSQILHDGYGTELVIGNALLTMYGKCNSLRHADAVFERMPKHDVISLSSLIAAYAEHGQAKESISLFQHMLEENILPNNITFAGVLDACANQAILCEGKRIHAHVIHNDLACNVVIGAGVINMYGRCGRLDDVHYAFDRIREQDVVLWNAMIAAYAQHGYGDDVLGHFSKMKLRAMHPDYITFISILSGCGHTALMDEAFENFLSMIGDYHITPVVEHCNCMVDLLARAQWLDEAEDLTNSMPFHGTSKSWMTLVLSNRTYTDEL